MHKLSFKKNLNRFQKFHVKRKRLFGNDSGIDQNISHFTIPTNLASSKKALVCVCERVRG